MGQPVEAGVEEGLAGVFFSQQFQTLQTRPLYPG